MYKMNQSGDEEASQSCVKQIVPIAIASLISVSFGMMLGWPSLAYPHLLDWEVSPIPITLEETSLIAGFLMEGNTLGVLFATSTFLPSKLAISSCFLLQAIGWTVMYHSEDIFWFLASRGTVGFANGFAWGQIRRYVKETCCEDLECTINNYMPLGLNVGVLLINVMGMFLDFRCTALTSLCVPIFGFLSFAMFPKNSKNSPKTRLNNVISVQDKNDLCKNMAPIPSEDSWSVIRVLQDRDSLKYLLVTFLLVFVQQYSGGPANIVYSQLIFMDTMNPYPQLCSVIYAFCFLVSMTFALTYTKNFSRKCNLLVSTSICVICLSLVSLYYHVRDQLLALDELFVWAPLFLLVVNNFFHTFSYAVLPLLIVSENIPRQSADIGGKFLIVNFSLSAVISTKIFQVLFGSYGLSVGYAFFVGVLVAAFFMVAYADDYAPRKTLEIPEVKVEEGHVNSAYVHTEGST